MMRVLSAWRKNRTREVLQSLGRFLAILSIVALGVGVFSGLKVTQRAMVDTADRYIKQNAMYDDKLISTVGWETQDVDEVAKIKGVTAAEGSVSMDAIIDMENDGSYVVSAHAILNRLNQLSLTNGRMPQAANECVGDADMLDKSSIGQKIRISSETDSDTLDACADDEYRACRR